MRAARPAFLIAFLGLMACGGSGAIGRDGGSVTAGEGGPATRGGDRTGPLEGADGGISADAPAADARAPGDAALDVAAPAPDAVAETDAPPPPVDSSADVSDGLDPCAPNGTCELLASDYRMAVVKDQTCGGLLNKATCAEQRPNNLYCSCTVWVSTTVEIDAVRKQADEAGCGKCRRICPLIACRALTTGVCRSKTPLVAGACADQGDPPTP
jgi:hypothetical protein